VIPLVANNFEQRLKGKNAFVLFHAPWCVPCQQALKTMIHLKGALGRGDVQVAAMDITQNDVPHANCSLEGLPAIFLFRAGD